MLRVQGIVQNIEHNSGQMKRADGSTFDWTTCHVEVDGERIKYRVREGGEMPVTLPSEGDEIVVGVSVGLKENAGNLLHPFSLSLTATRQDIVRTAAEVDEARSAASLSSVPAQAARRPRQTASA